MTKEDKKGKPFDGLGSARELLEGLDQATRERILKEMTEKAPDVASKLKEGLSGFQDLLKLSDAEIAKALRNFPLSEIALAIKNQSEETVEKITGLLPKRTQEELRNTLQELGKRRLSDVLAAQKKLADWALGKGKK